MVRENRTASFLKASNDGEDSSRYRQNYQRDRYQEDHHYHRGRERSPPPHARDSDRYYQRSPPRFGIGLVAHLEVFVDVRSSRHRRSSPPVDEEREFRGPRGSRRPRHDDRQVMLNFD